MASLFGSSFHILGNPEDVWALWLIRAVNSHLSGYIYHGSYFRCRVVECGNQSARPEVCVDWLLPHTRWQASSSPTQRTVAYVKISGKCFTKPAGEHPRNHNDTISFPIWMFQKKIGQLSNWKLTCLSLPKIHEWRRLFDKKKMLAA